VEVQERPAGGIAPFCIAQPAAVSKPDCPVSMALHKNPSLHKKSGRKAGVCRSDVLLGLTGPACVLGEPVREHAHHGHGDSGAFPEHALELTIAEPDRPHGAVRH
jgi:hypothetical protein